MTAGPTNDIHHSGKSSTRTQICLWKQQNVLMEMDPIFY